MKSVEILGVAFCNGTMREMLRALEAFLENEGMHAIDVVSTPALLESQKNPLLQEAYNHIDMVLMGDVQLLKAAGISTAGRRSEIENHVFFKELLKRLGRQKKSVFLLGENNELLEALSQEMRQKRISVAGSYAMEELDGEIDAVINEVNAAAPDVIFAILETPFREQFFMEQRSRLDAGLWYGMGTDYLTPGSSKNLWDRVMDLIHRGKLTKSIHEYDDEVEHLDEEP